MVVKSDGRTCPCGRVGCMEAYAGRGAMETRAREKVADGEKTILFDIMEERGKPRLSSGIWQRALEKDDDMAHHMIDRAVGAIGVASPRRSTCSTWRRSSIGGGLGLRLGDPYVEKIRDAMMPHLFADHRPPEVLLASLGDLGGAIGATLIAVDKAPAHAYQRRAAAIIRSSRAQNSAPRDRRGALRPEVVGGARGADEDQPAVVRARVAHDRLRVARIDDPVPLAASAPAA